MTVTITGTIIRRFMEIVNNDKYNDDKYKEKILQRISDATDEFKVFH
jgi:hypothetical protein